MNKEKPCGDDGNCYDVVGKKGLSRGPKERLRENSDDSSRNTAW